MMYCAFQTDGFLIYGSEILLPCLVKGYTFLHKECSRLNSLKKGLLTCGRKFQKADSKTSL